jgi:hypothetical protein
MRIDANGLRPPGNRACIAAIETRVVEERETLGGRLTEVSRNDFAISKTTQDVYDFGEDVVVYKNGKPVPGSDSWLAEGDNRCGLMMPGAPQVGARYVEEDAPGVGLIRDGSLVLVRDGK